MLRQICPDCSLICTFSLRHNWHFTRPGVYGLDVRIISHDIPGDEFRLFFHPYTDDDVAYMCFSFLKLFFVN